jgi:hypothetical protein
MRYDHAQGRTEAVSRVPAVRSQVAAPELGQTARSLPESQMQISVLGRSPENKETIDRPRTSFDLLWVKAIMVETDVDQDGAGCHGIGKRQTAFDSIEAALDAVYNSNSDDAYFIDVKDGRMYWVDKETGVVL